MKLWIDTEFNGYQGALISLALVDETGHEWYEVLGCEIPEPWVATHVMPVLKQAPIDERKFYERLQLFLNTYPSVHVIADWPDDIKYFCDVLVVSPGIRINTPPLTMEIRRDLNSDHSEIPHNALSDARALRALDLKGG